MVIDLLLGGNSTSGKYYAVCRKSVILEAVNFVNKLTAS